MTDRLTPDALAAINRHQRESGPQPGDLYRHYKGSLYLVTARAIDEATHADMIVYYALEPATGITWVRPTADFLAAVVIGGGVVPRFRREDGRP